MSSFLEKHPELLGLGEEETKVYVFLSREGESSAKVISYLCQIPYSRVHKVLHLLQQNELVISRGQAPKLFALRYKDPDLSKRILQGRVPEKTSEGN